MKCTVLFILLSAVATELAAQQTYTFVFLNKKNEKTELPKEELEKLMQGHLANIKRLAKEGKMLVAGPFDGGGGIFILNTASVEEAKTWLSPDPGIQANRWNVEMLPFTLRTGSLCKVEGKAEMVTYPFVRFISQVTKFNVKDASLTQHKYDDFVKELVATGNVLAEGQFPEPGGGILILKGDLQQEVIEQSPGVAASLFEFEMKNLWVAKGSFCE